MPKTGNTSESEDAGGRRDSPLSTASQVGSGVGLSQSLSIKQELMDAQQQQREHHVGLPPELLTVSLKQTKNRISTIESFCL